MSDLHRKNAVKLPLIFFGCLTLFLPASCDNNPPLNSAESMNSFQLDDSFLKSSSGDITPPFEEDSSFTYSEELSSSLSDEESSFQFVSYNGIKTIGYSSKGCYAVLNDDNVVDFESLLDGRVASSFGKLGGYGLLSYSEESAKEFSTFSFEDEEDQYAMIDSSGLVHPFKKKPITLTDGSIKKFPIGCPLEEGVVYDGRYLAFAYIEDASFAGICLCRYEFSGNRILIEFCKDIVPKIGEERALSLDNDGNLFFRSDYYLDASLTPHPYPGSDIHGASNFKGVYFDYLGNAYVLYNGEKLVDMDGNVLDSRDDLRWQLEQSRLLFSDFKLGTARKGNRVLLRDLFKKETENFIYYGVNFDQSDDHRFQFITIEKSIENINLQSWDVHGKWLWDGLGEAIFFAEGYLELFNYTAGDWHTEIYDLVDFEEQGIQIIDIMDFHMSGLSSFSFKGFDEDANMYYVKIDNESLEISDEETEDNIYITTLIPIGN